ncbi:hypothetical protein X797_006672 [Metarhizium robertsii]|uniref:Uncharacterized protein n=1 Tax=Metarhizium robertsii TaxID=568076 RepID=A0A0A1UTR9_9HYPO|nr:hypothetical protein X797_006672 [Metarhizium robertsii]
MSGLALWFLWFCGTQVLTTTAPLCPSNLQVDSTPKTPQCRLQKFFITRPACPHALLSATPDGNIDQLLPQSRPGILTIPVRVSVSTITRAERTGGTSPREGAEPKCQLMHGEQPPFSRPLHGSGKSQSAEDLGMRSSYSYLVLHVLTGLARLGKQTTMRRKCLAVRMIWHLGRVAASDKCPPSLVGDWLVVKRRGFFSIFRLFAQANRRCLVHPPISLAGESKGRLSRHPSPRPILATVPADLLTVATFTPMCRRDQACRARPSHPTFLQITNPPSHVRYRCLWNSTTTAYRDTTPPGYSLPLYTGPRGTTEDHEVVPSIPSSTSTHPG